jgi:[ribosomal protein S5]-alanine N-acetyltransferase
MLKIEFTSFPELSSSRIVLREITMDDAGDIYSQRTNPKTMKYLDRPLLENLEAAVAFIEKMKADFMQHDGISWMIKQKASGEVMGTVGLWRFDKPNHRAEIGYMLLPQFWGMGYGTEALKAVINFGFHTLNLHSIEANVNPENEASKRLLTKLGFRQEAYFRENYYFDGQFLDSAIFCLLKRDLKND